MCFLPAPRDEAWMQQVASEMNLSETAFLVPREDVFSLRWFTPAAEVDLCGHGTLAAAHALWQSGRLEHADRAHFHTRSGLLTADLEGDLIWLDFPMLPEGPATSPSGLVEALGIEPRYVGRFASELLVEVETEEQVRGLSPDFSALRALPEEAVVVTGRSSSPDYDFVSRCFAPKLGIDEDPVTGSVHCCLGPFWGARLGKPRLAAYQASRRGGVVHVELADDRVRLGGRAVTVLRGELLV